MNPLSMLSIAFLFVAGSALTTSAATETPHLDTSLQKIDIQFYSSGFLVKGWLFLPSDTSKGKVPVIIMAPGFAGVKESNYQFFAQNFSAAGFAVLLFDYPNFGESEGKLRQEVDPALQVQAYRDAIGYASTNSSIDPAKVGVWGGSFSGGHAIMVSALDSRVACFVAMTPFVGGYELIKNQPTASRNWLNQQFNADRASRLAGGAPAMIPVVSNKKGEFAAVGSVNAWSFVESFKAYAPNFKNTVTLKSLELEFEYEPGAYIHRTANIPKLFILATKDELLPESNILQVYNQAPEPKSLVYFEGHHFSAYLDKLKETADIAAAFFRQHLSN